MRNNAGTRLRLQAFALLIAVDVALSFSPSDADKSTSPTEQVVVRTGEVYLYGHKIQAPYTLSVADAVLSLNGIPVCPPLESSTHIGGESGFSSDRNQLFARMQSLKSELIASGNTSTPEITRSIAEFVRAEVALVDSVTDITSSSFTVWWRVGLPEKVFPVSRRDFGGATAADLRLDEAHKELNLWKKYLGENALVIYGPSWECVLTDPRDRPQVYAEIAHARETPTEVFDAEARVMTARVRSMRGDLPDSLRYLLDQPVWNGDFIKNAESARMFREPLDLNQYIKGA